jgi:hypothetical protein
MRTGSLARGKAVAAWRWPPNASSTEVKEGEELYLSPLQGPHVLLQGKIYFYLYLHLTCSTTPQVFHTHSFIHHQCNNILLAVSLKTSIPPAESCISKIFLIYPIKTPHKRKKVSSPCSQQPSACFCHDRNDSSWSSQNICSRSLLILSSHLFLHLKCKFYVFCTVRCNITTI